MAEGQVRAKILATLPDLKSSPALKTLRVSLVLEMLRASLVLKTLPDLICLSRVRRWGLPSPVLKTLPLGIQDYHDNVYRYKCITHAFLYFWSVSQIAISMIYIRNTPVSEMHLQYMSP